MFDNNPNFMQWLAGIGAATMSALPLLALIWLFAWLKDIRTDTRKILAIMRKHHPEEFDDD